MFCDTGLAYKSRFLLMSPILCTVYEPVNETSRHTIFAFDTNQANRTFSIDNHEVSIAEVSIASTKHRCNIEQQHASIGF
jgi:hypothetical protein